VGTPFNLTIPTAQMWSPFNPFLYHLEVQVLPPAGNGSSLAITGNSSSLAIAKYTAQVHTGFLHGILPRRSSVFKYMMKSLLVSIHGLTADLYRQPFAQSTESSI
jgi:hypothetical protein